MIVAASARWCVACRVFCSERDFDVELLQYRDPLLRQCLPQLLASDRNTDGTACGSDGFKFPPYLVLERGITLAEWNRQRRGSLEVMVLVEALAALLSKLHEHGVVHRDVKPGNVLYLTMSTTWRLMDMGITAAAGSHRCLIQTHHSSPTAGL